MSAHAVMSHLRCGVGFSYLMRFHRNIARRGRSTLTDEYLVFFLLALCVCGGGTREDILMQPIVSLINTFRGVSRKYTDIEKLSVHSFLEYLHPLPRLLVSKDHY